MSNLAPVLLGLVGLGAAAFLVRKSAASVASPSPTGLTVEGIDVEGRQYVVTRYGGGYYRVELMGGPTLPTQYDKGPVASIYFGQSGAPLRTGPDELIDTYILKDIHKFPSNLFGSSMP